MKVKTGLHQLGYSLFQKTVTFARDSTKKDTAPSMKSVYFTMTFLSQILQKALSN